MKLGYRELATIGLPVLVAIGACYVHGYWGLFEVNALEFVSFIDVAKIAVYPLAAAVFFAACFFVIDNLGSRVASKDRKELSLENPPAGVVHRNWSTLISILGIIGSLFFIGEPTKWFLIAMMAGIIMLPYAWEPVVVEAIPHRLLRYFVVIGPLTMMLTAFYVGRMQAVDVLTGQALRKVDLAQSRIDPAKLSPPVAYLGLLGDTHFLYEQSTDRVVLIKNSDDHVISFSPRRPRGGIVIDSSAARTPAKATRSKPETRRPAATNKKEEKPPKAP